MSEFRLGNFFSLKEFFKLVSQKVDRAEYYDVYASTGDDFGAESVVFIDAPVQADDEGNEIYPPAVLANKLSYVYSGEQFQDVVDLALRQLPSATVEQIARALNHYAKFDDFMDLHT